MKKRTLATLILTIMFISVAVVPIVLSEYQSQRAFVTSKGSKYCYQKGHTARSIKPANYIYYSTLALCGKPLK